jgi:hypothetical protein
MTNAPELAAAIHKMEEKLLSPVTAGSMGQVSVIDQVSPQVLANITWAFGAVAIRPSPHMVKAVCQHGTVFVFRQEFVLEDAVEFHAITLPEALPCM